MCVCIVDENADLSKTSPRWVVINIVVCAFHIYHYINKKYSSFSVYIIHISLVCIARELLLFLSYIYLISIFFGNITHFVIMMMNFGHTDTRNRHIWHIWKKIDIIIVIMYAHGAPSSIRDIVRLLWYAIISSSSVIITNVNVRTHLVYSYMVLV